MGVIVTLRRGSHTPSTTVASIIIDIPAYKRLAIWSWASTGMASALAAGETHGFYVATALGTVGSPTALTAMPEDDRDSVPAGWEFRFGFSAEPTWEANPRAAADFQPAGGVGAWPIVAGLPLIIQNESASVKRCGFKSVSGTSSIGLIARLELNA